MTGQEESRLSMYLSFKDYQAPYTAITNPLPNYTTNSTTFLNTIPQIQAISEQQKISKKGVTDGKNQLKESLIVTSADYFRKLGTYAKFTNNVTLAQEIKITESKLRQVADTAVRDYAQIAYDRSQPIVASLAAYGITAATQTALAAAITAYNTSIGKPGASRTEGGITTQQLKNLFKIAETALANMDAAIEIIRLTQVNFYNGYQKARKVIETGTSTLALKIQTTNAETGEPEANVALIITPTNGQLKAATANGKSSIVKKTAKGGGAQVKSIPDGTYTVVAKKTGFKDVTEMINGVNGEMTVLEIKMEKA